MPAKMIRIAYSAVEITQPAATMAAAIPSAISAF
jgi:hypothetical protein